MPSALYRNDRAPADEAELVSMHHRPPLARPTPLSLGASSGGSVVITNPDALAELEAHTDGAKVSDALTFQPQGDATTSQDQLRSLRRQSHPRRESLEQDEGADALCSASTLPSGAPCGYDRVGTASTAQGEGAAVDLGAVAGSGNGPRTRAPLLFRPPSTMVTALALAAVVVVCVILCIVSAVVSARVRADVEKILAALVEAANVVSLLSDTATSAPVSTSATSSTDIASSSSTAPVATVPTAMVLALISTGREALDGVKGTARAAEATAAIASALLCVCLVTLAAAAIVRFVVRRRHYGRSDVVHDGVGQGSDGGVLMDDASGGGGMLFARSISDAAVASTYSPKSAAVSAASHAQSRDPSPHRREQPSRVSVLVNAETSTPTGAVSLFGGSRYPATGSNSVYNVSGVSANDGPANAFGRARDSSVTGGGSGDDAAHARHHSFFGPAVSSVGNSLIIGPNANSWLPPALVPAHVASPAATVGNSSASPLITARVPGLADEDASSCEVSTRDPLIRPPLGSMESSDNVTGGVFQQAGRPGSAAAVTFGDIPGSASPGAGIAGASGRRLLLHSPAQPSIRSTVSELTHGGLSFMEPPHMHIAAVAANTHAAGSTMDETTPPSTKRGGSNRGGRRVVVNRPMDTPSDARSRSVSALLGLEAAMQHAILGTSAAGVPPGSFSFAGPRIADAHIAAAAVGGGGGGGAGSPRIKRTLTLSRLGLLPRAGSTNNNTTPRATGTMGSGATSATTHVRQEPEPTLVFLLGLKDYEGASSPPQDAMPLGSEDPEQLDVSRFGTSASQPGSFRLQSAAATPTTVPPGNRLTLRFLPEFALFVRDVAEAVGRDGAVTHGGIDANDGGEGANKTASRQATAIGTSRVFVAARDFNFAVLIVAPKEGVQTTSAWVRDRAATVLQLCTRFNLQVADAIGVMAQAVMHLESPLGVEVALDATTTTTNTTLTGTGSHSTTVTATPAKPLGAYAHLTTGGGTGNNGGAGAGEAAIAYSPSVAMLQRLAVLPHWEQMLATHDYAQFSGLCAVATSAGEELGWMAARPIDSVRLQQAAMRGDSVAPASPRATDTLYEVFTAPTLQEAEATRDGHIRLFQRLQDGDVHGAMAARDVVSAVSGEAADAAERLLDIGATEHGPWLWQYLPPRWTTRAATHRAPSMFHVLPEGTENDSHSPTQSAANTIGGGGISLAGNGRSAAGGGLDQFGHSMSMASMTRVLQRAGTLAGSMIRLDKHGEMLLQKLQAAALVHQSSFKLDRAVASSNVEDDFFFNGGNASSPTSAPPTIFTDDFGRTWRRSTTQLGKGAKATVYLGMRADTGGLVAIKAFPIDSYSMDEDTAAALGQEVTMLTKLQYKHVVGYRSFAVHKGYAFIIMEYVSGGTLGTLLESFGALPEQAVAQYVHDVLNGLAFLHRNGVLHGDIKAFNVLVSVDGACKISDFGTVRSLKDTGKHDNGRIIGSPIFMAPEQARGDPQPASDVWAVGLLTVHLMKNELPYGPEVMNLNPMQFVFRLTSDEKMVPAFPADISEDMRDFLTSCLHRDPKKRPTPDELLKHRVFATVIAKEKAKREKELRDREKELGLLSAGMSPVSPGPTIFRTQSPARHTNGLRARSVSTLPPMLPTTPAPSSSHPRGSSASFEDQQPVPRVPALDSSVTLPHAQIPMSPLDVSSATASVAFQAVPPLHPASSVPPVLPHARTQPQLDLSYLNSGRNSNYDGATPNGAAATYYAALSPHSTMPPPANPLSATVPLPSGFAHLDSARGRPATSGSQSNPHLSPPGAQNLSSGSGGGGGAAGAALRLLNSAGTLAYSGSSESAGFPPSTDFLGAAGSDSTGAAVIMASLPPPQLAGPGLVIPSTSPTLAPYIPPPPLAGVEDGARSSSDLNNNQRAVPPLPPAAASVPRAGRRSGVGLGLTGSGSVDLTAPSGSTQPVT